MDKIPSLHQHPAGRTAVLVIHGIGEQLPFQVLDAFAAGCWNALEQQGGGCSYAGRHEVRRCREGLDHAIVLDRLPGSTPEIEFREYYWADKVERLVELPDIVEWLIAVSEGARRFYDDNAALVRKYASEGHAPFRRGVFQRYWYFKELGWLLRLLALFPWKLLHWSTFWLSPVFLFLNPLLRWVQETVLSYLGDVVVYTSSDRRSEFYRSREAILSGATDAIRSMLEDPAVSRVVVAGHSLGSVIAYDALNRVNRGMNAGEFDPSLAGKLTTLITYGSPLDKIAFFFREHTPRDEYLRRQILQHHHSFKAKPLDELPNPRELTNPFRRYLDGMYWVNYWDRQDPVSGSLDFYQVDTNVELTMHAGSIRAHTSYVQHAPFLDAVAKLIAS